MPFGLQPVLVLFSWVFLSVGCSSILNTGSKWLTSVLCLKKTNSQQLVQWGPCLMSVFSSSFGPKPTLIYQVRPMRAHASFLSLSVHYPSLWQFVVLVVTSYKNILPFTLHFFANVMSVHVRWNKVCKMRLLPAVVILHLAWGQETKEKSHSGSQK